MPSKLFLVRIGSSVVSVSMLAIHVLLAFENCPKCTSLAVSPILSLGFIHWHRKASSKDCRVVLEVDQPFGSTFLLEMDRATQTFVSIRISCVCQSRRVIRKRISSLTLLSLSLSLSLPYLTKGSP